MSHGLVGLFALVAGSASVSAAWAAPATGRSRGEAFASARAPSSPGATHATPRLKLSYRSFAISNIDGPPVALDGVQLDVYPLSRKWIRGGFEVESGVGRAGLVASENIRLNYGLLGLVAGLQYPARITPFIEGRAAAGFLHGRLEGSFTVPWAPSVEVTEMSATTGIYGHGVDAGAEIYTFGRAYVSASLGWVRTTWLGPDYPAMLRNPSAGMAIGYLTGDSMTFKLGLGI
jgi:hypothetical protein